MSGICARARHAQSHPLAHALELNGDQGRVRSHGREHGLALASRRHQIGDLPAHRDAVNAQLGPPAKIRLHQHPHGVELVAAGDCARRRANPGLEAIGPHPGPAADAAFGYRPAARRVEGRGRMGGLHMPPDFVVEKRSPSLADYGRGLQSTLEQVGIAGQHPLHRSIMHRADAGRVGKKDGTAQQTRAAHRAYSH